MEQSQVVKLNNEYLLTQIRHIADSKATEILNFLTEQKDKDLFEAVIANLLEFNNKLRINNFSYAAREFIRIYIDKFAPDNKVLLANWIQPDHLYPAAGSAQKKPTRAAKMHYAIHKNLPPEFLQNELNIEVYDVVSALRKNVDTLSKYTHISEFPVSDSNYIIATDLMDNFYNFIKTLHETQSKLVEHLEEKIFNSVEGKLAFNTDFDDVDIIATHHWVDSVWLNDVSIVDFGHEDIIFNITGSICFGLQWGSDSDYKNDMGERAEISFEFSCNVITKQPKLDTFEVIDEELHIPQNFYANDDSEP